MAVLNIRVEERTRDQLKQLADRQGATVSEFVRDLILEELVRVYESPADHGDEPAPDSMRVTDRKVLSMLHRILAQVLPGDADGEEGGPEDQLNLARVIEAGYTAEYWREVAGFRTELSKRDCERVLDLLDMFRIATFSVRRLNEEGVSIDAELVRRLEFQGFDHNDALEGQMASYVKHLMDEGRWVELQQQLERHDAGNSHYRVLDMYMRMLAEYRRIIDGRSRGSGRESYLLTLDELKQIAAAQESASR